MPSARYPAAAEASFAKYFRFWDDTSSGIGKEFPTVLIIPPKLLISGGRKHVLAFERQRRPRAVNNFAVSALSGYEISSSSEEKLNESKFSNLAVVLRPLPALAQQQQGFTASFPNRSPTKDGLIRPSS